MIEIILGSKTNIRIIRFLLDFPNKKFSAVAIGSYAGIKGGNLYRSLNKLTVTGVLLKIKNMYKINYSNTLIKVIKEIFDKEKKAFQNIEQKELNIISDFVNVILTKFNDIHEIILFGSIARGMYSNKSDIDIMIIKDDISTKSELDLMRITNKYERKVQFFLHTLDDFKTSNEPLIKEIRNEGISLTRLFTDSN